MAIELDDGGKAFEILEHERVYSFSVPSLRS
jgi:hypothetical protein